MPIPQPRKGEKEDEFVSRCMGDAVMNKDYRDQKQRAAICYQTWRDKDKKKAEEPPAPPPTLKLVPLDPHAPPPETLPKLQHTRVRRFVSEHPWAILPERLDAIVEVLELRAEGRMFSDEEIRDRIGVRRESAVMAQARADGGTGYVAVLPLFGVIAPRMNVMTAISGGTSAESFGKAFRAAALDPEISAIVMDIDSPGGSVFGIEELAMLVHGLRGRKPVVAVANSVMASAAYWVASQADEIIATPSGEVGSIGVIGVHQDVSKLEEKAGITTTLITAGRFKGEGDPHVPLSDEAKAAMQARVDAYYDRFVADVARGRGVVPGDVRSGFGQGRVLGARAAETEKLIDGIATLDEVLARLASGSRSGLAAIAEEIPAVAVEAERVLGEAEWTELDAFKRRLAAYEHPAARP